MALTKITQGVIKPGENFDTHNINSTGIITASAFVGDGSALIGVASTDNIVTGTAATFNNAVNLNGQTNANNVNVSGVITATSYSGDGSGLTGVGGIGDGIGSANNLNYLFTSPELLELTANATISATEAQGKIVFTASDSIKVATGVTVTVAVGTTIRTNVLNLY